jgi:hypothetical protein
VLLKAADLTPGSTFTNGGGPGVGLLAGAVGLSILLGSRDGVWRSGRALPKVTVLMPSAGVRLKRFGGRDAVAAASLELPNCTPPTRPPKGFDG